MKVAKVSHMVSGLTANHSRALPAAQRMAENSSAWPEVSWPLAVGRQAVRAMRESIRCSTRQLNAAAAAATSQMPITAGTTRRQSGHDGVASSMPIAAQKTMSCTTRGLVRAWYWRIRDGSETAAAGEAGPGAAAGGGNGLRARGAVMAARQRAR